MERYIIAICEILNIVGDDLKMKINWRAVKSLPLAIRKEIYKRDIDSELKNFIEFEKSLGDIEEPEENNFIEEENEDLQFDEKENGKITIIKGDDPVMEKSLEELIIEFLGEEDLPVEFEKAQKVLPEKAKKALKEAFGVLNKYKESLNKDLLEAMKVLGKYIGYGYPGVKYPYPEPYPVKKELEKSEPEIFNWKSFFNFDDDSIEEEDIKKSIDPSDKFPTLTTNLLKGKRKRERAEAEREVFMGRRFV